MTGRSCGGARDHPTLRLCDTRSVPGLRAGARGLVPTKSVPWDGVWDQRYLVVRSTAPVPERVLVRPQDSNRPDVLCLGCSQLGAHGPADPQACVRFAPVAAPQPLANARLRPDARARDGGIPKKLAAGVKASRRRASIQDTSRTYRSLGVRLSVQQTDCTAPLAGGRSWAGSLHVRHEAP
jgi:hypothetical protein